MSVAVMTRIGCYLPHGVAVLPCIGGRYEPCWPLRDVRSGCSGPHRWAVMSRSGRYLPYGVVLLARVAGRYEPYWP